MSDFEAFLGVITTILFFLIPYYKLTLIKYRKKESNNANLIAFLELIFWMAPVFVGIDSSNKEYKKQILKTNIAYGLFVVSSAIQVVLLFDVF